MNKVWCVGSVVDDGWMLEGLFYERQEAADASLPGEFIALATIGERLPTEAIDAEALYFPNEEKHEDSALFKIRNGLL